MKTRSNNSAAGGVSPRRRWFRKRFEPAELYGRAARQGAGSRNPVIVIPGVMGSRLKDPATGRVMWGGDRDDYARQTVAEEARAIAHPMREGARLSELSAPLVVDGVVRKLHVKQAGVSFCVSTYAAILKTLGVGGYLADLSSRRPLPLSYGEESLATCFEFGYDWRLSLDQVAAQLMGFIRRVLAFAEGESDCGDDLRVDIVAHSMGGLIVRYLMRYGDQLLPEDGSLPRLTWEGAKHVEHVLVVGTPNAGAMGSVRVLLDGIRSSAAFPRYDPAMLGTLPAIYQLMPRTRHRPLVLAGSGGFEGLYDPEAWIEFGWGLADAGSDDVLARLLPDVKDGAGRRRIAHDHLGKCLAQAERFHRAIDAPREFPSTTSAYLFAGDRYPTARVAELRPGSRRIRVVETGPGDRVVLRSSALMDERTDGDPSPRVRSPLEWDGVTFLPTNHMSLTRDRTFVDTALWYLLEKPRPECDREGGGAVAAGCVGDGVVEGGG